MKYIVDKITNKPLCAVINGEYVDYRVGAMISDENSRYIDKGIPKYYKKIELDFNLYILYKKKVHGIFKNILGYIYEINGVENYLDSDERILNIIERRDVAKMISNGSIKKELIWNEDIVNGVLGDGKEN